MKKIKKLIIYALTHSTLFFGFYMTGVKHAEETRKAYHQVIEKDTNIAPDHNQNPFELQIRYERNGKGELESYITYKHTKKLKRRINKDLTCGDIEENLDSIKERIGNLRYNNYAEGLGRIKEIIKKAQNIQFGSTYEPGFAGIDNLIFRSNQKGNIESYYTINGIEYPLKRPPDLTDQTKHALRDITDYLLK